MSAVPDQPRAASVGRITHEDPNAAPTAAGVASVLRWCRFVYRDEDQLQAGVAAALDPHFTVEREVRLASGDRIDLLVGAPAGAAAHGGDVAGVDGVGVEVKLAGAVDRLHAQLVRYAACPRVTELLVVTTRSRHRDVPAVVGGKRCRVLHLGALR